MVLGQIYRNGRKHKAVERFFEGDLYLSPIVSLIVVGLQRVSAVLPNVDYPTRRLTLTVTGCTACRREMLTS